MPENSSCLILTARFLSSLPDRYIRCELFSHPYSARIFRTSQMFSFRRLINVKGFVWTALSRKLDSETHVFSVPDVMSSVTRMMHLRPFTVDFQESWKRTMFGCCSPFSISTSSLKRCLSALVSLRVCRGINTGLECAYVSIIQDSILDWSTS